MSDQDLSVVEKKLRQIIAPDRAALIIIDMQNDFVSPEGKMAEFGFYIESVLGDNEFTVLGLEFINMLCAP